MAVLKVVALILALVAVYIGYEITSIKVPDDLSYKTQGITITFIGRAIKNVASVATYFGADMLSTSRALMRVQYKLQQKDYPNVQIQEATFNGASVRIIDPIGRKPGGPAIVYMHGGGWVWREPESFYLFNSVVAEETQFLIVSVDYRLAPEHRYPAAVVDCEKVIEYLIKNAQTFKIDPKRIALMGDSAGGNLAAAVSLSMRDKKRPIQPKLQVLIYPVLQGLDFTLPSYQNDTKIVLESASMHYYVLAYLLGTKKEEMTKILKDKASKNLLYSYDVWKNHGHNVKHSKLPKENFHEEYRKIDVAKNNVGYSKELDRLVVDPYFAPLMADNLKGLPDTIIMTCQYDVLRDEGFLYASRLKDASVKVVHYHDMQCYHGLILVDERHPMLMKTYKYLIENV